MIRIARHGDLEQIMEIVKDTIEDLTKEGNDQWSSIYPTIAHFTEDIGNNQLYVYEKENQVVGFIVLNTNEDEAYKTLTWSKNQTAVVIHRFAIKRDFQRMGIGSKLVEFATRFAMNKGYNYIKVDTNSKNTKMNHLFKRLGFTYVGQVNLRGVETLFNCYEKVLEGEENETR